eukprot:UC4_evm1s1059
MSTNSSPNPESILDKNGVAVVTGGASGFGLNVCERLVRSGYSVAILDVSREELRRSIIHLRSMAPIPETSSVSIIPILCDVSSFESCESASREIDKMFGGKRISFLFNNAGISGTSSGSNIIAGPPSAWEQIFSVNVFGAVNIIKAFIPKIIEQGPLPSGKKCFVVTTSSVVGLLNHYPGPYSVSKHATTAVCEQFAIELEDMGEKAAHISPHSLHPTVAATNFLMKRGKDGGKSTDDEVMKNTIAGIGGFVADDIVDALFSGLADGSSYIIVDHPTDVPTKVQIANRMADQMTGKRPRKAAPLGPLLKLSNTKLYEERLMEMGRSDKVILT